MEEKAGKLGLEVNERKIKYMIMSKSESRSRKLQGLKREGILIAGVSGFKGSRSVGIVRLRTKGHRVCF
jgi:hypothetical protein